MGHGFEAGECVVFAEVARLGGAFADEVGQALAGGVGDVFIEGAWASLGVEDAGDCRMIKGAEMQSVGQRGRDVGAVVAFAECEDSAGVVGDGAALRAFEAAQEIGGRIPELSENGP